MLARRLPPLLWLKEAVGGGLVGPALPLVPLPLASSHHYLDTPSSRPRTRPAPPRYDFQFFQKEELEALLQREFEMEQRAATIAYRLKELRAGAARGLGAAEEGAADPAEEAARLEAEVPTLVLPPKDEARKRRLLEEGFGDWTRKDLRSVTNALEQLGRAQRDAVLRQVALETGKAEAEVLPPSFSLSLTPAAKLPASVPTLVPLCATVRHLRTFFTLCPKEGVAVCP